MEFRILGPVEVIHEGRALTIGGGRERALLALLLLSPNRVVGTEQVVDALWPGGPTGGEAHALHVCVSRLRRVLRAAGGDGVLVTRPPGYRLEVEPQNFDSARFEAMVAGGRAQAGSGDHEAAATTLRDALALWRGPALGGVADMPFARAESARLEEARLAALEDRLEADLACGRHGQLAPELDALTRGHPLRERLWGQRMLALYRSGRQADALSAYQDLRRLLRDDLGLEPTITLRRLETAILRHEAALDWPAPGTVVPAGAAAGEGPQAPAEERRWATVLFAGLSAPDDELDPEALRAALDLRRQAVAGVVNRFGGSLLPAVGDLLVAVFGAPVAHEDDAERAVRAALEIGAWASRAGVETGEILFGPLIGERAASATGQALTTAARLQALAGPGEVLVGAEAHRATRQAVRYRAVTPSAHRAMATPGRRRRGVSDGGFLGRGEELRVAGALWERVTTTGAPHLLTVLGPAGIGKTRLANELCATVEARGARAVWGRSLPYAEANVFGAFADQVRAVAGVHAADPSPLAGEKLARRLSVMLPPEGSAGPVAEHLGVMLGLATEPVDLDHGALLQSARALVEALGREQPTVFVFEDLHWAAPSLADLVEFLARRARDTPVLFLGLARPELIDARPAWGAGVPSQTLLPLPDLPRPDAHALVSGLLPAATEPGLVARVVERAGGNPLFLEELAASLLERGERVTAELPANIKAIIAARLDGLPTAERRVLLEASVIGATFWTEALRVLLDDEKLEAILDHLEARDLIRPVDAERFCFKHALTQEVAYQTLPVAARRARHATLAAFLETAQPSPRPAVPDSLLAHHWQKAGEPARAVPHLLAAAERARWAWAKGEAVRLYEEALALLPDGDAEQRQAVGLRCALTRVEADQYAEAGRELDALIDRLTGLELAEALVARAHCAGFLHEPATLATAASRAVELTADAGNGELRGPALSALALSKMLGGEVAEALALSEEALAVWPPGSRPAALAYQLGTAGNESYLLGRYDDAVRHGGRGVDLGREARSAESLLWSGAQLALGLAGMGRHQEALARLEELVALGHQLEAVPVHTAIATNVWAGVHRELLDLTEARRLNHEAIELAARLPFPLAVIQGRVDLLFADLAEGELGRAELAWDELRQEADAISGIHHWLVIGRLEAARAELSLRAGRLPEAIDEAAVALAGARRVGRLKYEVAAQVTLGLAMARSGLQAEALVELRSALAGAERLGHPPSVWRAARALAAALGDDSAGGRVAAAQAAHSIAELAGRLSPDHRRRFLAAVSAHDDGQPG